MADLKGINEQSLVDTVKGAAEYAVAQIMRVANEACDAVVVAARALEQVRGRSASDLLEQARYAFVSDWECHGWNDDPEKIRGAFVHFDTTHGHLNCEIFDAGNGQPKEIPPGKYRVLLLMLPIDDAEKKA